MRGMYLPFWIKVWLGMSAAICTVDVAYTILRPASLRGGSLESLFSLWHIYADVDLRYAAPNDLLTHTTGRLMSIEIVMNVVALALDAQRSKHAVLTAFTSTAFVLWKTVIYLFMYIDIPEGNESPFAPDISWWRLFLVFWTMNGIWVVVPIAVMIRLWQIMTASMSLRELNEKNVEKSSLLGVISSDSNNSKSENLSTESTD
ncbi:emopamil binding protein [Ditylenchus destructor]|nr:emopamil binding protein [Ditylenchus destructor]